MKVKESSHGILVNNLQDFEYHNVQVWPVRFHDFSVERPSEDQCTHTAGKITFVQLLSNVLHNIDDGSIVCGVCFQKPEHI